MKEKILLTAIALLSTIAVCFALPTFKNCGASGYDSVCSDTACRIDFDTNSIVTNCEMDFATPEVNGANTFCYWSNPSQIGLIMNPNGNSVNFYPVSPLTSLKGLHTYTICTEQTSTGR